MSKKSASKKTPSKSKKPRIAVLGGAGYVGLVTSAGLAELGYEVIAADLNKERVKRLSKGECPLHEEYLPELISRQLNSKRLSFTSDPARAITNSRVIVVAVGTPSRHDGSTDLNAIIEAAKTIRRHLKPYTIVVIKSTVPLGTVEMVSDIIGRKHKIGKAYDLASVPEFLREGRAVRDFFNPDRIIIGADRARPRQVLKTIHEPLLKRSHAYVSNEKASTIPLILTSIKAAQLIKHAANTFLANRLTFINEIASLCDRLGVPIDDVVEGLGHDPRIGQYYLKPGPGFGGPCLEKDLASLIALAEHYGYRAPFLRAMLERNRSQIDELYRKVRVMAGYPLHGKKIALFGLSFKAGTNDVRNSPALKMAKRLLSEGVEVYGHDPYANKQAGSALTEIKIGTDPYKTARHAHLIIITTEWPEFTKLDWKRIKKLTTKAYILDTRNLLNPKQMKRLGFIYAGLGRN